MLLIFIRYAMLWCHQLHSSCILVPSNKQAFSDWVGPNWLFPGPEGIPKPLTTSRRSPRQPGRVCLWGWLGVGPLQLAAVRVNRGEGDPPWGAAEGEERRRSDGRPSQPVPQLPKIARVVGQSFPPSSLRISSASWPMPCQAIGRIKRSACVVRSQA